MTNEAFSRVKVDAQFRDQGWEITNTNAVRFEYVLPDRTKASYGIRPIELGFAGKQLPVRLPRTSITS